ncbi:hypothetical protein CDO73_18860 [Saccharibacillus sp. O23]|uniref:hypothetical protein n=1 Tax=Saccharibacillus sp. O23 TaxID=2009338 RepID=UPI000B4E0E6E|nr:hypothetical protein [Saccharibacillus sp. O23]OWR28337.1 hypothetical protein CDO73_18860 [Saccharibacillus sp. O23]
MRFEDEHELWNHFRGKIDEQPKIDEELLSDILHHYRERPIAAMSSVVIALLKEDKITTEQHERIRRFAAQEPLLSEKAFRKESLSFEARTKIASGEPLSRAETERLYEAAAFGVLESAFDRKAIPKGAIDVFVRPAEGETDRKRKLSLFDKAQARLRG